MPITVVFIFTLSAPLAFAGPIVNVSQDSSSVTFVGTGFTVNAVDIKLTNLATSNVSYPITNYQVTSGGFSAQTTAVTAGTPYSFTVYEYNTTIILTGGNFIFTGSSTPPPIVTFTASPASITSSQTSTLTWSSTNANSCTASGAWTGTKNLSGTQTVTPTTTSTYTLTCNGAGGPTAKNVTITVNTTLPECNDGVDNDSDGQTDYPADVGCSSATDNTESPNPSGPGPGPGPGPASTATSSTTSLNFKIDNPLPGINTLPDFIRSLLDIVMTIGIPIVAIFIIYAGFLFVSARGAPDKLTEAKQALLWAVIGAMILLGAYVIATAIQGTVDQLSLLNLTKFSI